MLYCLQRGTGGGGGGGGEAEIPGGLGGWGGRGNYNQRDLAVITTMISTFRWAATGCRLLRGLAVV